MPTKTPKLILKVEFKEHYSVKFSLISLHPYYNRHIKGSKIHSHKDSDFIIFEGSVFKIDNGLISLPDDNCMSINSSTIDFFDELERYETLRDLKNVLIDWSKSKYWEGINIFSKTPEIEYRKNLWFLY